MRLIISALVLFGCSSGAAAEGSAIAGAGWYCDTPKTVFDYQISNNDARINNFNIVERDAILVRGQRVVAFSYAVANRSARILNLDAQVAGFDKDNKLIFALKAAPVGGRVQPGATEEAKGEVFTQRDDVRRLNTICLKIVGDYQ